MIGQTNDGVGVADIEVLRVRSDRIEGHTKRPGESFCKYRYALRFAVLHPVEDFDLSGRAIREENVAVGRHAQFARLFEPRGKEGDLETGRYLK